MAAQQPPANYPQGNPPPPGNYPPPAGAYPPQQQGPPPTGAYPPQQQPPPYTDGTKAPPPGQPGAYPQPPYTQNTTVIATQPTVVAVISFGEMPVAMTCPFCQAGIQTGISYQNGDKTWLWMAIFCFLGGLLCFWIPLVVDGFKDVHHVCPNCNRTVGVFKR